MKDKYLWSSGTVQTVYNKDNPYARGQTDYESAVDYVLTDVDTSPDTGLNPGNKISPTNWQYSIEIVQNFTGRKDQFYPAGDLYNSAIGVYGSVPLDGPEWERDSLVNAALAKLNANVRDQADWAEDIAQARGTAKSHKLSTLAKDLVLKVANLRHNPLAAIGATSSGYLLFRYVWKPIINNIYDTAVAALNTNDGGKLRIRASVTRSIDQSGRCMSPGSGSGVPYSTQFSNSGKQGCRISVIMRGMDENRLADFTTLDPSVLAWNLLPWSFVADWVYGIGGYLEAQEHALRFNSLFVSGYVTELYANHRKEVIMDVTSPDGLHKVAFGRARRKSIRFQRTVLSGWPLPRRPVLNIDLGSSKLLAAAALLGTILGRKR